VVFQPGVVTAAFVGYAVLFGVQWCFGSWVGPLTRWAGPAAALAASALVLVGLRRRHRKQRHFWIWWSGPMLLGAFVAVYWFFVKDERWYIEDTAQNAAQLWVYITVTVVIIRFVAKRLGGRPRAGE